MHELSIAQGIIKTASEHAKGARVVKVALVIGKSSCVMAESLRMYFDIFAEDTSCAGAAIEIETVEPKLRCKTCGAFFVRKPFSFACVCGGEGAPTEIGNEFYIKSITVEDEA
jgi:hydrogenase nickel incorporation protein HypA/HybF